MSVFFHGLYQSELSAMQLNAGESSKVVNTACSESAGIIIRDNDMVVPVVKSEPVDLDKTLPEEFTISCLVEPGSQSFLVS